VGRRHNDISVFKGIVLEAGRNKAANVTNIGEKVGSNTIANLTEAVVLNLARISRCSSDDKVRLKLLSLAHQSFIIDEHGFLVAMVLLRLPEEGGGGNLACRGVEAMGQVTSLGERHAHQTLAGWNKRGVNSEVSGTAREGLNIASPLVLIESVGLESAFLRQKLDLVNELVSTVVTGARVAFGVLVSEARAL